jgi:hypothetical protein
MVGIEVDGMETSDYQDGADEVGSSVKAASPNEDEDKPELSGRLVGQTDDQEVAFNPTDSLYMAQMSPPIERGRMRQ